MDPTAASLTTRMPASGRRDDDREMGEGDNGAHPATSSSSSSSLPPFSSLPAFSALSFPSASTAASSSSSSSLPDNPLASLVSANLKEWMKEEEEEEGEGEEDIEEGEEEEEEEGEEQRAETATDEQGKREAAKSQPFSPARAKRNKTAVASGGSGADSARAASGASSASAAAAAAAASSSASATAAPSTPAQANRGRKRKSTAKKSASDLVPDDSAELAEILGAGYGAGRSHEYGEEPVALPSASMAAAQASTTPAKKRDSYRGKMQLLRRSTRTRKLSQLTPDLEKKMGDANSAYISSDFARAVDILLHIIQQAPHALGPYHTLGLIYEERGDMQKALEAFLLAAHMSKRDWELWKRVARMASESGQLEQAIYCWNKILLSEPDNFELRFQRALAYFELKDYRRALDGFLQLLKRAPHDTQILRQAASCYSHLKRPQSGVTLLLQYVKWFKETVEENSREGQEGEQAPTGKKAKTAAGVAAAADSESDPSSSVDCSPPLTSADLDINLINILCELYLDLHKFQEVLDLLEELLPYLNAATRLAQGITDPQAKVEMPFDLHSKLGIAYLYLGEHALADAIFAPLLLPSDDPHAPVLYDVDSWGDLYLDIAESYLNNKKYEQTLKLCKQLLEGEQWRTTQVFLLQAKAVHFSAYEKLGPRRPLSSLAAETKGGADSAELTQIEQQLRHALRLYERVHTEEQGENLSVRVSMSEIYQRLGQFEEAKQILQGIDVDEQMADMGASFQQQQDELRLFHQSCELLLQANTPASRSEFLRTALPVVSNLISTAVLAIEDEDEPLAHEMRRPQAEEEGGEKDGETAAQANKHTLIKPLPVDKAHATTAQRLLLRVEFLRPAFAALQELYHRSRLAEALWILHHLERVLLRYQHSPTAQAANLAAMHRASGGRQGDNRAANNPALPDYVRMLMLALKYVSACIFYHLRDYESAYKCMRVPLQHSPRSFPLAHAMNLILSRQHWPGKAMRTLERLLSKHPDALPVQLLLGHGCLAHQNYDAALHAYLQVLRALPQQPLLHLLVGVCKMQIALKKTNPHRHQELLTAFAYIFQYAAAKKKQGSKDTHHTSTSTAASPTSAPALPSAAASLLREQEADFNVARAFHYVGLLHLARPYYERVLSLSGQMKKKGAGEKGGAAAPRLPASLHSEAAHNLAVIYAQTGSPELARRMYAQYCRV